MISEKIKDQVRDIIEKIPATFLLVLYCLYLVWGLWTFYKDDNSPLNLKKREFEAVKAENRKLEKKLKELGEFAKTLEAKKVELRRLAQELQSLKGTIPEVFDTPSFMKMAVTEAKKVGLKVNSVTPKGFVDKSFYSEYNFNVTCKGRFPQVLAYLDRMSNVTEIVRVNTFSINSTSDGETLDANLDLQSYRYVGTSADGVGGESSPSVQGDKPGQAQGAQKPSGASPPKGSS